MKKQRIGKNQQKLILLLWAGLALGLTRSPRVQYKILRGMRAGFHEIDQKNLTRSADALYKAGLLQKAHKKDGVTSVVLSPKGKREAQKYHIETLNIQKPHAWDKRWRVVMYDIPESKRELRLELSQKLNTLGFIEVQQSVYVHPYECAKEIEFLVEAYEADAYIRTMLAEHINNQEALFQLFQSREVRRTKNTK